MLKACRLELVGETGRMSRYWLILLAGLICSGPITAEEADNLARIHVEAIGGKMRLNSLNSLQVSGHVLIDQRTLLFTLLAERPNRFRMETWASDHVIVQATDGVNPPWQMDPNATPLKPKLLTGDESREFAADSEFDDPLVDYAERGYTLDFAGTDKLNGRKMYRLLVTRRHLVSYYLFLDAETYFIAAKRSVRRLEFGREINLETIYEDFRPVGGIIMPHHFTVTAEEKLLHETFLNKVETNVPVPQDSFTMPVIDRQNDFLRVERHALP